MTPARSEEAARAFFGCVLEEIDSGGVAVERVRHSDRCFDYNLCVLLAALLRRTADQAREECCARFRVVGQDTDYPPHEEFSIFLGDLCVESDVGSRKDAEAVLAQYRKALLTGKAAIRSGAQVRGRGLAR